MRVALSAAILLCVCASYAFAQCPAEGEIDVAHSSAQDIASRGVDLRLAAELEQRGRSFQGFADLEKFAGEQHWEIPKGFVVCKGYSGQTDSVGGEDPPINVNSSYAGDLSPLQSCGVSLDEIAALAKKNSSGVSFRDNKALAAFLATRRESTSRVCRSLKFALSGGR
jgi:hypothetical protein